MDRKEGIIHLGGSKSPIRKTTTNSSSNFYHNQSISPSKQNQFSQSLTFNPTTHQNNFQPQTVIFSQTYPSKFPSPPHSIQQKISIKENRFSPLTKSTIRKSPYKQLIFIERQPLKTSSNIRYLIPADKITKNPHHNINIFEKLLQLQNQKNSQILSLNPLISNLKKACQKQQQPKYIKIQQYSANSSNSQLTKKLQIQNTLLKNQLISLKNNVINISNAMEQKIFYIISSYQTKITSLTTELHHDHHQSTSQLNHLSNSRENYIDNNSTKINNNDKQLLHKQQQYQNLKKQLQLTKRQLEQYSKHPSQHKSALKIDPPLTQKRVNWPSCQKQNSPQKPRQPSNHHPSPCQKCKQLMKTIVKLNQQVFTKTS